MSPATKFIASILRRTSKWFGNTPAWVVSPPIAFQRSSPLSTQPQRRKSDRKLLACHKRDVRNFGPRQFLNGVSGIILSAGCAAICGRLAGDTVVTTMRYGGHMSKSRREFLTDTSMGVLGIAAAFQAPE